MCKEIAKLTKLIQQVCKHAQSIITEQSYAITSTSIHCKITKPQSKPFLDLTVEQISYNA